MRSVMNVLLAVDTQSILARCVDPSQDAERPTHVTHDLCLIVAPPARTGSGGPHRFLAAPVGTALRWRAVPLAPSAGDRAILYGVEPLRAASVMSRAAALMPLRCAPLPVFDDGRVAMPPAFIPAMRPDYHMAAEITGKGRIAVRVRFYLTRTNPASGEPELAGYFEWRPTVTAS